MDGKLTNVASARNNGAIEPFDDRTFTFSLTFTELVTIN